MSEDEAEEEEEEQETADEEEEATEENNDDFFGWGTHWLNLRRCRRFTSRSWPRGIRTAVVCAGAAGCLLATLLPFPTPFARFAATFAVPTAVTPLCPVTFLAPLAAISFRSATTLQGGRVPCWSASTRATLPDHHGALQPRVVNVGK